jgi:hypothetical protein
MKSSPQALFRDKALQQYVQGRNKTILPRYASPPVFLCGWILLALLVAAGIVAWLGQVPVYVTGSGIVLSASNIAKQPGSGAVAVIFVPATPSLVLRSGSPVQVQIGATGLVLSRTIASIEPDIISPSAARQRYRLNGNLASVIVQPSFVVTVALGPDISTQSYAGSSVSGQVQTGMQRVLLLFPGIHQLMGA